MVAKRKLDETGDSDDLQSLFDNIAAGGAEEGADAPAPQAQPVTPAPTPAPKPVAQDGDDSDDLQALFDSEAGKYAPEEEEEEVIEGDREVVVFKRLGKMTRKLHDMLIELGLDNKLQAVADTMPDTRQRLTYIAQMTEQAASKVLNATDVAKPLVAKIQSDAGGLRGRWDQVFSNQLSVDEFKALANDTRAFLGTAVESVQTVDGKLTEIMLAQDFQDLTGQVIKKILEMAHSLETQLLGLLIEAAPEELAEKSTGLLNGPVIDGKGRDDVVTDQGQVDDLPASLGF